MEKEKIREIFDRLQKMTIQATLDNLEIMTETLYDLREEYQKPDRKEAHDADTE